MNGKITVALAGLGSRGKDTYAKAAKVHPDKMEIVAIADINPKKVEMVAEEYHIPKERCYASAEEMLKEEKLADESPAGAQKKHAFACFFWCSSGDSNPGHPA